MRKKYILIVDSVETDAILRKIHLNHLNYLVDVALDNDNNPLRMMVTNIADWREGYIAKQNVKC